MEKERERDRVEAKLLEKTFPGSGRLWSSRWAPQRLMRLPAHRTSAKKNEEAEDQVVLPLSRLETVMCTLSTWSRSAPFLRSRRTSTATTHEHRHRPGCIRRPLASACARTHTRSSSPEENTRGTRANLLRRSEKKRFCTREFAMHLAKVWRMCPSVEIMTGDTRTHTRPEMGKMVKRRAKATCEGTKSTHRGIADDNCVMWCNESIHACNYTTIVRLHIGSDAATYSVPLSEAAQ